MEHLLIFCYMAIPINLSQELTTKERKLAIQLLERLLEEEKDSLEKCKEFMRANTLIHCDKSRQTPRDTL